MTFSEPQVAAFVNANFVSAWFNRGAGFHNEDYSTERWIFTSAMEAYTTKNIATFFLTPDGRVFHYVAGYYSPDVFVTYLQAAMRLRTAAFDEKMRLKAGGLESLRAVHGDIVKTIARTETAIAEMLKAPEGWKKALAGYETYSYRTAKHEHTRQCANNLHEGYRYLTRLHKHWSEVTELPDLKDVQFKYLWGNPFTEEAAGSTPIEWKGGDLALVKRRCVCE